MDDAPVVPDDVDAAMVDAPIIPEDTDAAMGDAPIVPEDADAAMGDVGLVCSPGRVACADACVDTNTDSAHCGGCGQACAPPNAVGTCTSGSCAVMTCNANFDNCDGMAANGCEVDARTTVTTGSCGTTCALANATPACIAGACAVQRCSDGYADCDGMAANGCEVQTSTAVANCGACGRACAAGQVCTMGACMLSCAAPTTLCTDTCANLTNDRAHCGSCTTACRADETCAAGRCACPAGRAVCGGVCQPVGAACTSPGSGGCAQAGTIACLGTTTRVHRPHLGQLHGGDGRRVQRVGRLRVPVRPDQLRRGLPEHRAPVHVRRHRRLRAERHDHLLGHQHGVQRRCPHVGRLLRAERGGVQRRGQLRLCGRPERLQRRLPGYRGPVHVGWLRWLPAVREHRVFGHQHHLQRGARYGGFLLLTRQRRVLWRGQLRLPQRLHQLQRHLPGKLGTVGVAVHRGRGRLRSHPERRDEPDLRALLRRLLRSWQPLVELVEPARLPAEVPLPRLQVLPYQRRPRSGLGLGMHGHPGLQRPRRQLGVLATDMRPGLKAAVLLGALVLTSAPGGASPRFVPVDPTAFAGITSIELPGGGVALADVDGDGHDDVRCARGRGRRARYTDPAAWRLRARGPAPAPAGAGDAWRSMSVAAADVDGDGRVDLLLGATDRAYLLFGRGDGGFDDRTALAFDGLSRPVASFALADVDGDGLLDVHLVTYLLGADWPHARCAADALFLQRDEAWVRADLPNAAGGAGCGFGAVWFDQDGDGDADAWVANDFGPFTVPSHVWRNDGVDAAGRLRLRDAQDAVTRPVATYAMGVAVGDVDADGLLDVASSSIGRAPLHRALGGGRFDDQSETFGTSRSLGRTGTRLTWGVVLADLDGDGTTDLFEAGGYFPLDPLLDARPGGSPTLFYAGGRPPWTEDTDAFAEHTVGGDYRGVAAGDLDGDGAPVPRAG
ncbi:MAG: VCBS repeat-containing protein [Deltaproteobacteria bacterium]|nr:VCBS repeat-containing protein [Deltaproteobacteria bacterium]